MENDGQDSTASLTDAIKNPSAKVAGLIECHIIHTSLRAASVIHISCQLKNLQDIIALLLDEM